jgi:hypothetical protein
LQSSAQHKIADKGVYLGHLRMAIDPAAEQ